MKVAPIVAAMKARPQAFQPLVVHTGQHYDADMSDSFFRDLQLPQPDTHLGVGSGSHAAQTAAVMERFEPVVLREQPDWVLVVGDVASMHVDLALPNVGIQEYSGASRPLEGLVEGGFTIQEGHLAPTGEPGLGLRVNVEALANLEPLRQGSRPRWRRPDGAVQDW